MMEKLLKTRKQAFAVVDVNIKSPQKKQKETYDWKHQPAILCGDRSKRPNKRKGEKLNNLWLGAYIVHIGKALACDESINQ